MSDQDWYSQVEGALDTDELHSRAESLETIPDIKPQDDGTILCPVLPLREVIVFPHMVVPLPVGRSTTLLSIEAANSQKQIMVALPQINPRKHDIETKDFLPMGVSVAVSDVFSTEHSDKLVMVQGRQRVEIINFQQEGPVLFVRARIINEAVRPTQEQAARMRSLTRYLNVMLKSPGESQTKRWITCWRLTDRDGWRI